MKKILFLLIITCLLACNKNSNSNNVSELGSVGNNHSLQQETYIPLFLNLNPKMPDNEFEQKLKSSCKVSPHC
jgi:hypothetical protein